jgi:hypothetical protein
MCRKAVQLQNCYSDIRSQNQVRRIRRNRRSCSRKCRRLSVKVQVDTLPAMGHLRNRGQRGRQNVILPPRGNEIVLAQPKKRIEGIASGLPPMAMDQAGKMRKGRLEEQVAKLRNLACIWHWHPLAKASIMQVCLSKLREMEAPRCLLPSANPW